MKKPGTSKTKIISSLQGLAFNRNERQLLGINGLLPAVVKTEEEQVQHCILLLNRCEKDIDKYVYLNNLYVRVDHPTFIFHCQSLC